MRSHEEQKPRNLLVMDAQADLSVPERIAAAASVLLRDCTRVLVFDERGIILYSNFEVSAGSTFERSLKFRNLGWIKLTSQPRHHA